jgi:ABC-type antimicrobial peptide transport system permease subunit
MRSSLFGRNKNGNQSKAQTNKTSNMGRALLYAIIGFFLTATVVALIAPLIFHGANMEKVGELIGAPLGFVGGIIGFIYGLISSRRIKQRKKAEQD